MEFDGAQPRIKVIQHPNMPEPGTPAEDRAEISILNFIDFEVPVYKLPTLINIDYIPGADMHRLSPVDPGTAGEPNATEEPTVSEEPSSTEAPSAAEEPGTANEAHEPNASETPDSPAGNSAGRTVCF